MSLSPINQTNLFSLDNYLLEFIELYKKKKLPTKILFWLFKSIMPTPFLNGSFCSTILRIEQFNSVI